MKEYSSFSLYFTTLTIIFFIFLTFLGRQDKNFYFFIGFILFSLLSIVFNIINYEKDKTKNNLNAMIITIFLPISIIFLEFVIFSYVIKIEKDIYVFIIETLVILTFYISIIVMNIKDIKKK